MRAGRAANSHHFGPATTFFSAAGRPVLPLSFSFRQDRGHLLMIDATHLKAHRTASGLKKGAMSQG